MNSNLMIKYLNKIFHPFINEKKILFLDSFEEDFHLELSDDENC